MSLWISIAAAQDLSPRLERLRSVANDPEAITAFWNEVSTVGAPLVEDIGGSDDVLVTFLLRSAAELPNPIVFASVLPANDGASQRLTRLPGTDVWFRTYRFGHDVPIVYELSSNGPQSLQRDTLNPRFIDSPMGGSIVTPRSLESKPPALSRPIGRVEQSQFPSKLFNNQRKISTYLPPGFQLGREYDLVMVLDEDVFNGPVNLPSILDEAIGSGRLRPVVAAMIGNVNRERELSCNADFSRMLATEFLPWIKARYNLRGVKGATIVGSSLGGLAAACAGFRESRVFSNVIALSGSFRWRPDSDSEPEWFTRQIAASAKLPVRFFVGAGTFETGTPGEPANPSLLTAARHLRDILQAKGYRFTYREFPGAHEPLSWSLVIGDALVSAHPHR